MTSSLLSVALIVIALSGLVGLRTRSKRVRIGFDILLLVALTLHLQQENALPFERVLPAPTQHSQMLFAAILILWWLICARLTVATLYFTLGRDGKPRHARLFLDLLAAALYICVGLLLTHWLLDLPVRGLVATSGVVAVVIGLALQSTLADVFAGIAVGIENPFQVGDRISLTGNLEGQIVEINWRSIRIQTDGADLAIVPNSLVARQQIINRSTPSRVRRSSIEVWCPVSADSERVISVLQEAILLCPTILVAPAPAVSMVRLAPVANCYSIAFSVMNTDVLLGTQSELLRHARRQLVNAGLLERRKLRKRRADLGEVSLFKALSMQQLDALSARATRRLLEPGDILLREGSFDRTLYLVASGVLELSRATPAGESVTLARLGAGECVGEIGLVTGSAHPATALALSQCEIMQLPEDAVRPLISANADMATELEKTARRALEVLKSSVAPGDPDHAADHERLLDRLRSFFAWMEARKARQGD